MSIVLADLGGTHIRMKRTGNYSAPVKHRIADHTDFAAILHGFAPDITALYLASAVVPVAGIIEDRRFNDAPHWIIDLDDVKTRLHLKSLVVLNDLEAAAYGLLETPRDALLPLLAANGYAQHFLNAPQVIVSIGTGTGHAYIFRREGDAFVQPTHGGHIPLAAVTEDQAAFLRELRTFNKRDRDLIYEDIISGYGHQRICNEFGPNIANRMFAEFMGLYCNMLVSAVGAYGGVCLTGGTFDLLHSTEQFDANVFAAWFRCPMVKTVADCLAATPVYQAKNSDLPLAGLEYLQKKADQ